MTSVWLLVTALAFTPLVLYWGSDSPFLLTKAAYVHLLGAFACLAVSLRALRHPPNVMLPRALLAPTLFVGYAALRAPWFAETRPEIAAPFLWGALLLVAWPTATMLQTTEGALRRHAALLVLLGGLTAAYALLQTLGVGVVSPQQAGRAVAASFTPGAGQPPYATLGNPNFLAEYLAALLPLALAGAASEAGGARWTLAGAAGLMALALPLTLDRGAWLAAFTGIAVTFFLGAKTKALRQRLLSTGCLMAAAILLAAVATERWTAGASPWQKLVGSWAQVTTERAGRRLWWDATLRMVADHPLAGVGTGQFREFYPAYQGRVLASLGPDAMAVTSASVESPHNDYLQVAADLGIPGFLLLAGALALLLRDGGAAVRQVHGPDRLWRAGCLGGLVTVLTAGLLGYPLHTASGLYIVATLAALAVAPSPRQAATVTPTRWQWWLLVAVTALGFWQSARLLTIYAASLHLHRGSEALLRRDPLAAIDALERAHEVSPRDSQVRVVLGRAYLLTGRPDLALPHLQAGLHGFDAAPLRTLLGNAYALAGQDQLAEEMYKTGVTWFPGGHPPLYLSYARFLAARGRMGEAGRELLRVLAIDPKLAEAHYLLGQVRAGSDDPAGAAVALRRFLDLAQPSDPRVEPARALLRRLEGAAPPH